MSIVLVNLIRTENGETNGGFFSSASLDLNAYNGGLVVPKTFSEVLVEFDETTGLWNQVPVVGINTVFAIKVFNPVNGLYSLVRDESITDLKAKQSCYNPLLLTPLTPINVLLNGVDTDATNNFSVLHGAKINDHQFNEIASQDSIIISVPKVAGAIDEDIRRFYYWDYDNNYFNYLSDFKKIGETTTHWIIKGTFQTLDVPGNNPNDFLAIRQIKTLEIRRNGVPLKQSDFTTMVFAQISYASNGLGTSPANYGVQLYDPSLYPLHLYGIPSNFVKTNPSFRSIIYMDQLVVGFSVVDLGINSNIPSIEIVNHGASTADGFTGAHVFFRFDPAGWPEDGSWYVDIVDIIGR